MRNKVLIIDGNNLAHRAYHKYKSLRSSEGKKSSIVFGFPYILNSLINLHKPDAVEVVFDGGRDKARLKALPNYKDRPKKDDFDYEDFQDQKKVVMDILACLGVPVIFAKKREADDLIWLVSRKYARRKWNVVIVSTDKDFPQLMVHNKNISIWNPWKAVRITYKNCKQYFPFTAEQCVDYLILDGDASDNIPGYKGVGPKTAIKFLETYGSIENYLNDLNLPEDKKIKREVLADIYKLNKYLIDIRYFVKLNNIKLLPSERVKGNFNTKKLFCIISDYEIEFFRKGTFITTFKNLK